MGANLGSLRLMYFFPALCQNSKWGKSWLFYGWRTFFLLSFKIGAYIGFTKAGVFFSCSLSKLVQILAPLRLVYFFPALCQNEANPGSTKEVVFFFLLSVKMGGNLSFTKGPFNIYVNRILTFFNHPLTPSKQTQYRKRVHLPHRHKNLTDHLSTSTCIPYPRQ